MNAFRINIYSDITLLCLGLFFIAFGVGAVFWIHPVAWFIVGVGTLLALSGVIWGQRWVELNEHGITTQHLTKQDVIPWSEVKHSDFEEFEGTHSMELDLRNGKKFSMAVEPKNIPTLNEWIASRATLEAPSPKEEPGVDWVNVILDWVKPAVALILGVFLSFLSFQMCVELYNGSRATNWPTADGTIIGSSVKTETKTSGRRVKRKTTYYKPVVEYEYAVEGKQFQGERISFSPFSTTDRNEAYEFSNSLFTSPEINVRYDPSDPSESVLLAGAETDRKVLTGLMTVGSLAAIGFGCYQAMLLMKNQPKVST